MDRTGTADHRRDLVNAAPAPANRSYYRAAGLMLASTLAFGLMAITIRYASATVATTEIAFFRNFFGLIALLPLVLKPGQPLPRTKFIPRYVMRTVIGLASMLCGFWALGHLPLSQAVSLSYSTPLFVTIAAALWLHEKVRKRRWAAVLAGFVGVLVVLRPGADFNTGMLVALAAAVISAVVALQIKQLAALDPPDTVVFYTYVFWVPLSLVPALFQWTWPHGIEWLWLGLTGLFGTAGQVLWTRALRIGEVSALQPISFMQLPVVIGLGWWLFGETIDGWTLAGAAIILASNAYIAHREAVLAKQAASSAPTVGAKPGE